MDLTPYEGKKVRLTVVYEGTLTQRSLRAPEYVIKGDGHTLYVNPDHVTDVEFSSPGWWPPLPGDVLYFFGNDPADLVYTVTMDGNTLLPNKVGGATYEIEDIQSGKRWGWVHDPDQWSLLHKGACRLAKEGK